MNTDAHQIAVGGIEIEVVRKKIKNLHLGVYPPDGRVRVASPMVLSDEAIRMAVIQKLGWIRRQKNRFEEQPRQSRREMITGESHYFMGRQYRLQIIDGCRTPAVVLGRSILRLRVRSGTDRAGREEILSSWYRRQLQERMVELLAKWSPIIGVQVAHYGIKRMKTRWGSCNAPARRIWLNLELAKKPITCVEYVLVHEMVHLLVRHHDSRFVALMDQFMPQWHLYRDQLNRLPVGYSDWAY